MSKQIAAVILAGGLGTRLREVLPDLPKPMAPVAGRPFVEWVVRYLAAQGITDIVLSTGYRAEAFTAHFASARLPRNVSVRCVAEPAPLGTAGGFHLAAEESALRPDAWLVLNGDSLVLCDLAPLLRSECDAALLARWMDDASRYGSLEISSEHRLRGFTEKRPGAGWINGGVYLVRDALVRAFPTERPLSWELDVFPWMLRSGHEVEVVHTDAAFLDIGLPETLREADAFIRANSTAFAE